MLACPNDFRSLGGKRALLWPCHERSVNIRLRACAAPATVKWVTVYRAVYKGRPRAYRERTVSDDCGVVSESKLLLSRAGKVSNNCKVQITHCHGF